MKRVECHKCNRPLALCYCKYIKSFSNSTAVHILQHPSEAKQAFQTAIIAHRSFENSNLIQAEQFDIAPSENSYLLYPGGEELESQKIDNLYVLDGTWSKTTKILEMNPSLKSLKKVSLNLEKINYTSEFYKIRKAPKDNMLNTLEAITFALEHIENINYREAFAPLNYILKSQAKFSNRT